MKLRAILKEHDFAMNEITGQLVRSTTQGRFVTIVPGIVSSPADLSLLLFDQTSINNNWSPLSNDEAISRIDRFRHSGVASAVGA